jgi:hypothetical protein
LPLSARFGLVRAVAIQHRGPVGTPFGARQAQAGALWHLRALAALGIDHALLSPQLASTDEDIDAVASIAPQVHAIGVASAT